MVIEERQLLTGEQQRIASVLADARKEALEERPLSCASINSVIDRLVAMWQRDDATFDAEAFRSAANYRGYSDGTTGYPGF
jgi:hypothetical protein